MGEIRVNDIIYGTSFASGVTCDDNETVQEKLSNAAYIDIENEEIGDIPRGDCLYTTDIIDNLESESDTHVLSAKQGKILNEKIKNFDLSEFGLDMELTQAEYDELVESEEGIDPQVTYFITDSDIAPQINFNKNLSDFFSISNDYVIGDYCIYNNQLYEFIADKSAGDWDESKVKTITIKEKIDELNSNLPFKLGIDENGNYGYIKDGADTVIPFKTGVITETELDGLRSEIIAPLKNASSDINDDSSFSDIVSILWDLYPNEILMKLYSAGANTGNFAQFGSNGVSSVSIGSSSIGLSSRYDEDAIGHVGIITASKYNLDKLTKLTITYSASSTISKPTAPYVAYVKIGLFKNKSFSDTEAIIFTLANNFASAGGTIINDISDISGEYYIGVMIHAPYYYKETTSCSITEITLSNY